MRRLFIIGIAMCCFAAPTASLAQPTGGTGNHGGNPVLGGSAPTLEEYVNYARQEIATALDKGKISAGKAERDEKKLDKIDKKLGELSKEVSAIRHSLP